MPNSWFRFYNEVVDDPKVQRLSPMLFRAWANLMCLASKNDGPLPAIDEIAYKLRVTEQKAQQFITDLESAGLVDRNETELFMHNWHGRQFQSDTSRERTAKWRAKRLSDGACDVTVTPDVTHQTRTDTDTEQIPPVVPQGTNGYTDEFESFWQAYPRKDGKGSAFKAWRKIRPSKTLQEIMLSAIERSRTCRDWNRDGGQFIPHAATWLNGSRWDDEPDNTSQPIQSLDMAAVEAEGKRIFGSKWKGVGA